MPDNNIYFIGLLANTDNSILKVKLENGFKIRSLSYEDILNSSSAIGTFLNHKGYTEAGINHKILSTDRNFYFIYNSYETKHDVEHERFEALCDISERENINSLYLSKMLRLMRLFKEGNIHMPIAYNFTVNKYGPRGLGTTGTTIYNSYWPVYTLEESEVIELENFIKNTKLPFVDFLQLAFQSFELSYQTHSDTLSFLSLMISMEIMFHPAQRDELTHRIARNAAVFLGKDKADSNEIFKEIKELYGIRSALVHSGTSKHIDKNELLLLRKYVRDSIKQFLSLNKNRDILQTLNTCGFGDRTWCN